MRRSTYIAGMMGGLLTVAFITACGDGNSGLDGSAGQGTSGNTTQALQGTVHGGQQPVTGSQVTAYVAGDGSAGSAAAALACVKTDASGSFNFGTTGAIACTSGPSLPTTFTCPSSSCPSASSQIYLVAAGGNPGLAAGTNNTALVLMAVLGPYSSLSSTTQVNLTELTTVAAVYPLEQMMGAAGAPCVTCSGGLAARLQAARSVIGKSPWLDHAVARADSLVNFSTSATGAALPARASCTGGTSDPVNCGAEEKLDSLADALAACVNTSGPTSSACAQLFCVASPGAQFSGGACTPPAGGAVPTDTLQSALAIVLNPGILPAAGIFNLVAATPPFTPVLPAAPTDWTLTLNFTGGGLSGPVGIAIDASGNVWVANNASGANSLSELSSIGVPLSPSTGYTGGSLFAPYGIAIDAGGNVWAANFTGGNGVSELSSTGTPLSPSMGYTGGGVSFPTAIAIDTGGNVWVVNNGNSVSELSSTGTPLSPSGGYTGGGLQGSYDIAIDASGNVWVPNVGQAGTSFCTGSNVTQLSSAGAALSPSTGYTAGSTICQPLGIAIDAAGNVWVPSADNSNVIELNSSGAPLSPSGGYTGGGLSVPYGIAIDGGGNAWVANTNDNSVTELNNSGTALNPSPIAGTPLSPATGFTGGVAGAPTGGGFNAPTGVAIDADGNVWVTNRGNSSVNELIGAAAPKKTPFIGPPQSP